jgi:hypothetical protein
MRHLRIIIYICFFIEGLAAQPLDKILYQDRWYCNDACMDYDGGVLLLGFNQRDFTTTLLNKTDVNGNIIWTKALRNKTGSGLVYGMAKCADGGTLLTGFTDRFSPKQGTSYLFVFKLDACGKMLWSHIYPSNDYGQSYMLRELPNKNILVAAQGIYPNYGTLVLLNPQGQYLKQFTTQQWTTSWSLKNSELLTAGFGWWPPDPNSSSVTLYTSAMALDTALNLNWENVYDLKKDIIDDVSEGIYRTLGDTVITINAQRPNHQRPNTSTIYIMKRLPYGEQYKPCYLADTSHIWANLWDAAQLGDTETILLMHNSADIQSAHYPTVTLMRLNNQGVIKDTFIYEHHYQTYKYGMAVRLLEGGNGKYYSIANITTYDYQSSGFRLTGFDEHLNILSQDHSPRNYDTLCSGMADTTTLYFDTDSLTDTIPIRITADDVYDPYFLHYTHVASIPLSVLQLYPNPANEVLNISLPGPYSPCQATCYFVDMKGRICKQQTLTLPGSADINALSPGFWTIKLYADGKLYTGRFIKVSKD